MSGHWWACEHPERQTDGLVRWHYECHGCAVKAQAMLVFVGDLNDTETRILEAIVRTDDDYRRLFPS